MKKIYTFFAAAMLLFAVKQVQAQSAASSFLMQHDTVAFATGGSYNAESGLNNATTNNITIQWRVIASDFPTDWIGGTGICDNLNCFTGTAVWPSGTTYSCNYTPGMGSFHMTIDLSPATVSLGTHYMKVKLNNMYAATDTAIVTFIATKLAASVPVVTAESEVALYPNPASSELNVVYSANSDIKTISVYSIIGKLMTVYKPKNNAGANLNLENLSSGIYFVRLMNSKGDVVTTKKFTKQ